MAYSLENYFEIRSLLDAFEAKALAYCLNSADDAQARERYEFLKKIIESADLDAKVADLPKSPAEGGKCPPTAPYECDGICLPYPCPNFTAELTD